MVAADQITTIDQFVEWYKHGNTRWHFEDVYKFFRAISYKKKNLYLEINKLYPAFLQDSFGEFVAAVEDFCDGKTETLVCKSGKDIQYLISIIYFRRKKYWELCDIIARNELLYGDIKYDEHQIDVLKILMATQPNPEIWLCWHSEYWTPAMVAYYYEHYFTNIHVSPRHAKIVQRYFPRFGGYYVQYV